MRRPWAHSDIHFENTLREHSEHERTPSTLRVLQLVILCFAVSCFPPKIWHIDAAKQSHKQANKRTGDSVKRIIRQNRMSAMLTCCRTGTSKKSQVSQYKNTCLRRLKNVHLRKWMYICKYNFLSISYLKIFHNLWISLQNQTCPKLIYLQFWWATLDSS